MGVKRSVDGDGECCCTDYVGHEIPHVNSVYGDWGIMGILGAKFDTALDGYVIISHDSTCIISRDRPQILPASGY